MGVWGLGRVVARFRPVCVSEAAVGFKLSFSGFERLFQDRIVVCKGSECFKGFYEAFFKIKVIEGPSRLYAWALQQQSSDCYSICGMSLVLFRTIKPYTLIPKP